MIIYICGPITGKPNNNVEAFEFAQQQLLRMGHHPINPHTVCRDIVKMHQGTERELWVKCMKRDIGELIKADAVVVLDGWEKSKGATLEAYIAAKLDMPVYSLNQLLNQHGKMDNSGHRIPESKL